MAQTTSLVKHEGSAVLSKDMLQISGVPELTEVERREILDVLSANPNAQKTIMRLSGTAVSMREHVRGIDKELAVMRRQLKESDLYAEIRRLGSLRRSCLEYQAECEAQERGVWASLLSGLRTKSKLFQKILAATRVLGEGTQS
jgi:hypothetical protein